jgi:uncharacterized protein (DUF433 family)
MMSVAFEAIPVPLFDDGHGGLRVGATRISFESLWRSFQQGAGPREIVQAFHTLDLTDVCAALAWALRHSDDVTAYLKRRDEEAIQIRRQLEEAGIARTPEQSAKLKEQLIARRNGF